MRAWLPPNESFATRLGADDWGDRIRDTKTRSRTLREGASLPLGHGLLQLLDLRLPAGIVVEGEVCTRLEESFWRFTGWRGEGR